MKTVSAAYQTRTDALQKAPAYKIRAFRLTGGIPSGTERAFSRDFVTVPLQAQTGTKLVCLDAPQGNVQTVFPEQGQSSIGSFTFPLYDRDGEITRQIGNPQKGLLAAITATVPATGGNLDADASVAAYPAKGAVQIDDEIFLYASLDTANNRFVNITRGAHGTTAAAHAINATINNFEQLRLGSRLQLFAGYTDLNEADFMSFTKMEVVDIRLRQDLSTYEIVCADVQRFTRARIFTGATATVAVTKTGNPVTLALQVLLTSTTAGKNHVTYDLGDGNGLDLAPILVDIAGLESLRDTEFAGNTYSFTIREPQDAKAWLEREIWQTLNCVPFITQDGKYSAKRLKNAGAAVGSITKDHVVRVVGWREATDRVINVLDFRYDFDLDGNPNAFGKRRIYLMDGSIADFGRRPALVIESRGIKSANGGDTIADNRALRISDRWASPPPALVLDLFYEKHLFDIGDQVSVTLPEVPDLKGVRSLTSEGFEVLDIRPMFDPVGQAGMQVTLLWLASVLLPPAPSSTTQTPTSLERDTQPPATPVNVVLQTGTAVDIDGTVKPFLDILWSANTENDLEGYEVDFRRQGDATSSRQSVRKDITAVRTFAIVGNFTYEVRVKAVDVSGNASAFTAIATIVTAKDSIGPPIPTGVIGSGLIDGALIQWNTVGVPDFDVVEIFRNSVNDFATSVKAGESKGTSFVDIGLKSSTSFFYWIRSRDTSGNLSAIHAPTSNGLAVVTAGKIGYKLTLNTKVFSGTFVNSKLVAAQIVDKVDSELDWLIRVSGDIHFGETTPNGTVLTALGLKFAGETAVVSETDGTNHQVATLTGAGVVRYGRIDRGGAILAALADKFSPPLNAKYIQMAIAVRAGKIHWVLVLDTFTDGTFTTFVDTRLRYARTDLVGTVEVAPVDIAGTISTVQPGDEVRIATDGANNSHILFRRRTIIAFQLSAFQNDAFQTLVPDLMKYVKVDNTGAVLIAVTSPFSNPTGATDLAPAAIVRDLNDVLHVLGYSVFSGGIAFSYGQLNLDGTIRTKLTLFLATPTDVTFARGAIDDSLRFIHIAWASTTGINQMRIDPQDPVGDTLDANLVKAAL